MKTTPITKETYDKIFEIRKVFYLKEGENELTAMRNAIADVMLFVTASKRTQRQLLNMLP